MASLVLIAGGADKNCPLDEWTERSVAVSADEHKAVIRQWIEGFNDPDAPAEADHLASGYVAHVPGVPAPLNAEQWMQFGAGFTRAFPDLRLTVEDIMAEGDMVAARVSFRGTHAGEFQGIPPTNKQVAFSSIEINRMEDGKVAEHWFELDMLGLLQQLGGSTAKEA
jgi:steroid delta-isomerase-like uncharacterized protein